MRCGLVTLLVTARGRKLACVFFMHKTANEIDWSSDVCSSDLDRFDEAEPLFKEVLAAQRAGHRAGDLDTILTMHNLRSEERRVGKECCAPWAPTPLTRTRRSCERACAR